MRYLMATLPLALILALLLSGATGCDKDSNPALVRAEKSAGDALPTTVDGIARWHNLRVEERVGHFLAGGRKTVPDMEATLAEWGCLDKVDLAAVRRDWSEARRFMEGGFVLAELENLLESGLSRAAADPDVSPRFLAQLRHCLDLLLKAELDGLFPAVDRLAEMARREGTPREKGLAGVLLGSTRRATADKRLPPDHPLYPIVVGYDQVGTLFGGPFIGALYSAQIEMTIIFCLFPWIWG